MAEELRYRFTGDGGSLARTLNDTASKADRAGDALDDLGGDARKLDAEISDLRASMQATAREIARSADEVERKNLFKVLAAQKRQLGQQTRVRDLLGDDSDGQAAGQALARGMVGGLRGGLTAMSGQAQAAVGQFGAIVAAGASPLIGAAMSAAIIGGISGGAVAVGVAQAVKDPRVKGEVAALRQMFDDTLGAVGDEFAGETGAAVRQLRREWRQMDPEIRATFSAASEYVDDLTAGGAGFARAILPGIRAVVESGGPVIDVLRSDLPALGRVISDQLEMVAGGSDDAADALSRVFTMIEVGVSTVGPSLRTLTEIFGLLDKVGAVTGVFRIIDGLNLFGDEAEAAVGPAGAAAAAAEQVGTSAAAAAPAIQTLAQRTAEWTETNTSAFDAETQLGSAIDDATAAAQRNNAGLSANTEAGRSNREALSGLAGAALKARDAIEAQTGSGELANGVMQRSYNAFIKAAAGMNVGRAEADRLARSLGLIPPAKSTQVSIPGAPTVKAEAGRIKQALEGIEGTYSASVRVTYRATNPNLLAAMARSGNPMPYSQGGVVDGPRGAGDVVPALLTPQEGVLTVDGLRRLGGPAALEAINRGTTRPVAGSGGTPAPASAGSRTYAITVNVPPTANPSDVGRATVEAIQAYEQRNGTHWRAGP